MKELELYIHIPFCVKKCKYCDFLSFASTAEERKRYVESLCRRIRAYESIAKAYCVVSIFFGGGTPSLLEEEQMTAVFRAITDTFCIQDDAEITVEMNPGTVTKEKLCTYRRLGVNRLSIGLQSVNNHELRMLGRIHTYEQFIDTYVMARACGFDNINVDLISAIPGQTVESYQDTLETVARLEPEHISAYSLIIEEGTEFFDMYGEDSQGTSVTEPLPDEDAERMMYQDTKKILKKYGYERYEISNYAKNGYACKHNLGYWRRREYLGIGLGASSFFHETRWTETDNWERFCGETEEDTRCHVEILSRREQMEEFMFLGLRTMEGIDETEFLRLFDISLEDCYGKEIQKLIMQDLLEREGTMLRLTEKGIDVSNYVFCAFLRDEE